MTRFPNTCSLDVVGIGNAIVDVLVQTDDAFLEQHGLQKGGMALIDEQQAETLYTASGPGLETSGGSVANTMVGIAQLGGRAYLRFLADLMEVPIAIVSLGASRDQTIVVEDPIHGPKRALLSA